MYVCMCVYIHADFYVHMDISATPLRVWQLATTLLVFVYVCVLVCVCVCAFVCVCVSVSVSV